LSSGEDTSRTAANLAHLARAFSGHSRIVGVANSCAPASSASVRSQPPGRVDRFEQALMLTSKIAASRLRIPHGLGVR